MLSSGKENKHKSGWRTGAVEDPDALLQQLKSQANRSQQQFLNSVH